MMDSYFIEISLQLLAIVISVVALKKKTVSWSGFLCMVIISSFFIWNNGLAALVVLFSMFISSSMLTLYKHSVKVQYTEKVLRKNGPRDYVQAICNLGVAFSCFLFYIYSNDKGFLLALLCSVAASNADSWASEIGVLSKRKPVLITNFKICQPGISGGITLLGSLAGISGSIFIAIISVFLKSSIPLEIDSIDLFLWITISGISGLFLDSLLGATIQVIYRDANGIETENTIYGITKSRGLEWINNDFVNFITSFYTAVLVYIIYHL